MTHREPYAICITKGGHLRKAEPVFCEAALNVIRQAVRESKLTYEAGGLFLGDRTGPEWTVREAVIVPSAERDRHAFVLDGLKATQLLREAEVRSEGALSFLGIWHSHVTGIMRFSEMDREANRKLYEQTGIFLSALVVSCPENGKLRMTVWKIEEGNADEAVRIMDF